MYYSLYSTNECIQLSYFSNQNILFLPPVQEDPEPHSGGRAFPRKYHYVSSSTFLLLFPGYLSLATVRDKALGWIILIWPGIWPLFFYAQVIIEAFSRVHKCMHGSFGRDWRRKYQQLDSLYLLYKVKGVWRAALPWGLLPAGVQGDQVPALNTFDTFVA